MTPQLTWPYAVICSPTDPHLQPQTVHVLVVMEHGLITAPVTGQPWRHPCFTPWNWIHSVHPNYDSADWLAGTLRLHTAADDIAHEIATDAVEAAVAATKPGPHPNYPEQV